MGIKEIYFVDFVVESIKDFGIGNLKNYLGKLHEDFEGFVG